MKKLIVFIKRMIKAYFKELAKNYPTGTIPV